MDAASAAAGQAANRWAAPPWEEQADAVARPAQRVVAVARLARLARLADAVARPARRVVAGARQGPARVAQQAQPRCPRRPRG